MYRWWQRGPLMDAAPAPSGGDGGLPPVPAKATDTDAELRRLRAELDQHKGQMTRMQEHIISSANQPAPPATPAPPVDKKGLEKEFFKSPLDFSAQIASGVAGNVANALTQQYRAEMGPMADTLRRVARDSVRNKSDADREIFDKYEVEIEARVSQLAPNFQANVNVWQNAFDIVKGAHFREILDAERQREPRAPAVHISSGDGPTPPSRGAPAPATTKLSEEERLYAKRLGLTEDQYKAGKEHLEGQSEHGPSSWDKYITFDSREKRRREREQRSKQRAA